MLWPLRHPSPCCPRRALRLRRYRAKGGQRVVPRPPFYLLLPLSTSLPFDLPPCGANMTPRRPNRLKPSWPPLQRETGRLLVTPAPHFRHTCATSCARGSPPLLHRCTTPAPPLRHPCATPSPHLSPPAAPPSPSTAYVRGSGGSPPTVAMAFGFWCWRTLATGTARAGLCLIHYHHSRCATPGVLVMVFGADPLWDTPHNPRALGRI